MKKKLAFILSIIMLLGTSLICLPVHAAEKTAGGPLAITEMCPAPTDAKYEYIEIVNTSDSAVKLSDYYVYRFGFSNSGRWGYAGPKQLLGINAANANLAKVSLASSDVSLGKGQVALIWFASAVSKDETVDNFKTYWQNQGADMSGVTVVKLPVYNEAGSNMFPSTSMNAACGDSFLPDKYAGFIVSLINKSFADTDDIGNKVATETQKRHKAADSIAMLMLSPTAPANKSVNYYDYVDPAKFAAAENDVDFSTTVAEAERHYDGDQYLYPGLMVCQRADDSKENLMAHCNLDAAMKNYVEGFVYISTVMDAMPSPGIVYVGQMGLDGEIPAESPANGVGSLKIEIKGETVENLALGEIPEDTQAATEDNSADAPSDTTSDDKGGCGSALSVSAMLVLVPVLAAGALTGRRRKENDNG